MPLLVTVTLIPGGRLEEAHDIAQMLITNDGSNPEHPRLGNYKVVSKELVSEEGHLLQYAVDEGGHAQDVAREPNVWHFLQILLTRLEGIPGVGRETVSKVLRDFLKDRPVLLSFLYETKGPDAQAPRPQ
jgi:hypothetical protein